MAIIGVLPVTLANGTTADATQVMSDFNFIASQVNANSAALAGGNAFTGTQVVPVSSARNQAPQTSQVQDSSFVYAVDSSVTVNLLTLSLAPAITAYVEGQSIKFKPANTNTGPTTVNVNAAGVKNVFAFGAAFVGGELVVGIESEIVYDGTQFGLITPSAFIGPVNKQGANIASAATVNLETATGEYVHITGTTTITAVTLNQGHQRTTIFDGALSITNGASLILPGGQNITTTAGATAVFVGEAAGVVRCIYISSFAVSGLTSIRQTFLGGKTDVNGYANWLSAGAALNFNVAATAIPLTMTFANGFTTSGNSDLITQLAADASNLGSLSANVTNYISATNSGISAVTWGSTLAPPQYGYAYDQTKQSLLRFAGANNSTTILDDYGNTWAAAGGAKISTATLVDTLNTLLLGGAGDWVDSTNITSMGSGSWTVEIKVRWPVLPAANTSQIICEMSTGGFGMQLLLFADATPTRTFRANLSSNGSSNDIAALVGAGQTFVAATTYHVAICFDALAGKYFVYKDGVLDSTVTSSLKIAAGAKMRIGSNVASGTQGFNGNVAGFRFLPYCAYPNGTTFTPPTISTFTVSGVTSSDWYSISDGKMYGPTVASASGGINPTLTAKNIVYGGEQDTNASAVTATRNYAYQGRYISPLYGLALNTQYTNNHNIGVVPQIQQTALVNQTTDAGWTPGEEIPGFAFNSANANSVGLSVGFSKTVLTTSVGLTEISAAPKNSGTVAVLAVSKWKLKTYVNRGF